MLRATDVAVTPAITPGRVMVLPFSTANPLSPHNSAASGRLQSTARHVETRGPFSVIQDLPPSVVRKAPVGEVSVPSPTAMP